MNILERRRNLPFGKGVLSLPQRGETTLELYAHANVQGPIERFDGHSGQLYAARETQHSSH